MNKKDFIKKRDELNKQLDELTQEYIDSNKLYSIGDYLRVSFVKSGKRLTFYCKMVNIYLKPEFEVMPTIYHKKSSTIIYFARYCWKTKTGEIETGDPCPLSELSLNIGNVCGHRGLDFNTLKIDVIDESEIPEQRRAL